VAKRLGNRRDDRKFLPRLSFVAAGRKPLDNGLAWLARLALVIKRFSAFSHLEPAEVVLENLRQSEVSKLSSQPIQQTQAGRASSLKFTFRHISCMYS